MLSEPPHIPVYAVSRTVWQDLKTNVEQLPEPVPGAQEWQVWNYSTALDQSSNSVDPLSLILSLRDDSDERVQGKS